MDIEQPDGEITSIDWYPRNFRTMKEDTPIVFFCPGLLGISRDRYAYKFCKMALKRCGWRSFVYHRRLLLNEPKGNVMNSYTTNDDWVVVLNQVKKLFPSATIYMVGVSMGALNIQRYLIDYSADPIVKGAVTISSPWNAKMISDMVMNSKLLCRMMLPSQLRMIRQHMHSEKFLEKVKSKGIDLDRVFASKTNREFDQLFSVPDIQLKHSDEYYARLTAHDGVQKISVPLLAINSLDDTLIPRRNIPEEEIVKNPNVVQLMVAGGGHIEYFHGLKRSFVRLD